MFTVHYTVNVPGFLLMSIVAFSLGAKAKTALTYCCVGALSVGASQVYQHQSKPKAKARIHQVAKRAAAQTAALCPAVGVAPILAPGERLTIPTPERLTAGFFPDQFGGGYFVTGAGPGTAAPVTDVPEPGVLGLFALGVAAVLARRLRRSA